MKTIILYEKKFQLRKELSDLILSQGVPFESCYSLSKVELLKSKMSAKDIVFIMNESDTDLEEIKSKFNTIYTYNENDFKNVVSRVCGLAKSSSLFSSEVLTQSKHNYNLICIGGSTGGLPVLKNIMEAVSFKETIVVVCQHIGKENSYIMYENIAKTIGKKVFYVDKTTELKKGQIYILSGCSDFELKIKYGRFYLNSIGISSEVFHPSYNILTKSLLSFTDINMACIFLSGLGDDGSKYLKELKDRKVKIIAQSPDTAIAKYMPETAIKTGFVDHIFNESELQDFIRRRAA
jgi:two-component system, chemotaxis family, protein-glutamate methylesterase/glutaminase